MRAAAKIAAFVAAASFVLAAMPAVYSTTVDTIAERSYCQFNKR
jgi:hypothetical protein